MSIVDKLRSLYGVKNYISKHLEIREKDLNVLFLRFAETSEWKKHFAKSNSKNYKGSNKPYIDNAHSISLNCFDEFKKWLSLNKN
jgi:hypothetical protein